MKQSAFSFKVAKPTAINVFSCSRQKMALPDCFCAAHYTKWRAKPFRLGHQDQKPINQTRLAAETLAQPVHRRSYNLAAFIRHQSTFWCGHFETNYNMRAACSLRRWCGDSEFRVVQNLRSHQSSRNFSARCSACLPRVVVERERRAAFSALHTAPRAYGYLWRRNASPTHTNRRTQTPDASLLGSLFMRLAFSHCSVRFLWRSSADCNGADGRANIDFVLNKTWLQIFQIIMSFCKIYFEFFFCFIFF